MLIGIFQDWATEDPDPLSAKNNLQPFLKNLSSIWDWREERNLPREGSNTGRGAEGKPASDMWLLQRKSTGELSLRGTQPRLLGGRQESSASIRKGAGSHWEAPSRGGTEFPLKEGIQGKEGQPAPVWVSVVIRRWGETCQGSLPPPRSCYWSSLWGLCSPGRGGNTSWTISQRNRTRVSKIQSSVHAELLLFPEKEKIRSHICLGQRHTASWGPRDPGIRWKEITNVRVTCGPVPCLEQVLNKNGQDLSFDDNLLCPLWDLTVFACFQTLFLL